MARGHRPNRCEYNNKDEDNSPKTLNGKSSWNLLSGINESCHRNFLPKGTSSRKYLKTFLKIKGVYVPSFWGATGGTAECCVLDESFWVDLMLICSVYTLKLQRWDTLSPSRSPSFSLRCPWNTPSSQKFSVVNFHHVSPCDNIHVGRISPFWIKVVCMLGDGEGLFQMLISFVFFIPRK